MLAKYADTSYFNTKDQKLHSEVLSSVHLRSASLQSDRWEKDWSLVSQRQSVNGSANSQQNVLLES